MTTYSESHHGLAEYYTRPFRENETKVTDDDVLKLNLADGSLVSLVQPVPYDKLRGLGDFEEGEDQLPGETDPNKISVVGSSSSLLAAGGTATPVSSDDEDDLVWVP